MNKRAALLVTFSLTALLALSTRTAAAEPFEPPTSARLTADVPDVLPGEIVVDVDDRLSDRDIDELGKTFKLFLRDNSPGIKHDGNVTVANVPQGEEASFIERLMADPRVEAVEPVIVAKMLWSPNDPKYSEQWHMKRAGAERAWEYACGSGVTVAVIDTGVACYDDRGFTKGTDLAGTKCVKGYNFVGKNELAADDQGHGTHVAGTIAQTTNNALGVAGLAHCAKLMPVKVLSSLGWGTMADVAEGIRWAADHGARVINLSLGASVKSRVVERAVKYARDKGLVIVAAAGNSGRSVGWPAAYPGVIAVSATDRNDNLAWFSSRGPEIALAAPGVLVTQQTVCEAGRNKCEQWGVFSGTSMASPHVAGAAALLVGQGVTSPERVRAILQSTASPKSEANLFGAGILDAGHAVRKTHWLHVAVRLAVLTALAWLLVRRIKKKGLYVEKGAGKVLGALFASVGLLPVLPLFDVAARADALRTYVELAMKPLGEWTLVFAPSVHAWLPLASVLPVLGLMALFFGSQRLRPVAGGIALGTAALLVQLAISGDTSHALGPLVLRMYCALNALLCFVLARLALETKKP